jgi:hypothetical protein
MEVPRILRGGTNLSGAALIRRLLVWDREDHMDSSIAVVVECLGHLLDDITEDILTEPLPRSIGDLLSPQHQPNVLCALVYSLSVRDHFKLIECSGELFIEPRSDRR